MIRKRPLGKYLSHWLAVGILLLLWGRLLNAAGHLSATFDEPMHLLQGVLYWQQETVYSVVQNPPLINALMGLPVHLLFHPALPPFDTAVIFQDWLAVSRNFTWVVNDNGLQLLWAARWVVMLLTLLLGALVYRFAGQLARSRGAGLLALFLVSFDPNILAHGTLATTDLGLAFFLLLAVYSVWRYWQRAEARPKLLWGAAACSLGLAFAAKFTAVILIPALFLLVVYRGVVRRAARRTIMQEALVVAAWIIVAVIIFLLFYRGQLPALQTDFQLQQEHQLSGHSAFFHGQLTREGWWYYFPLTFLIKTPLPTMLLAGLGLFLALWRRAWPSWAVVWILLPAAAVFASGLISQVNIGYRYLLPALPLLIVLAGQIVPRLRAHGDALPGRRFRLLPLGLGLLLFSLMISSLAIHPSYLSYFNLLVGGPANGWRWLVDSNLDWGQDLMALADYEKENLSTPYWVAWLGSAPLEAYGIEYGRTMPIWPQGREDPLTDPFYPPAPAPGTYVLSATQLHGVYLKNQNRFAWFQKRAPTARIGYALFVYDVPPTGPAVGLGLSGIGPAMIAPEDYQIAFTSNDVQPRWFDARTCLLWPIGGSDTVWTAVGAGHLPENPLLKALYAQNKPFLSGSQALGDQLWRYNLYQWRDVPELLRREALSTDFGWAADPVVGAADWEEKRQPLPDSAVFGNAFALEGYQAVSGEEAIAVLGFWQVQRPPEEALKIFVHLLDAEGNVVSQHDGLDVAWGGLQAGDIFAQLHIIPLPAGLGSGIYGLQMGLYQTADGARLPLTVPGAATDRLLLQTVEIGE